MSFVSIVPSRTVNRAADTERTDILGYRLTVFLWVLYLFVPQKAIQYHFHDARPLTWGTEALLWVGFGLLALHKRPTGAPKRNYPAYALFVALTFFGMAMGAIYGDWDFSRAAARQMYQYFGMAVLLFTFCDTPERAKTALKLYLLHFFYFGLWGVYSLYRTPIVAGVDPGFREIVYWNPYYDNRDNFGPLMAAGVAFGAYYLQAVLPRPKSVLFGIVACLIGAVTSFARATFGSLVVIAVVVWWRSKMRLRLALLGLCALACLPFVAPNLVDRYTHTMTTIVSEGADKGTNGDRKVLWGWGLRVFGLDPVFGVGPSNFGIAVLDVVPLHEAAKYGYDYNHLHGRKLHSTLMSIMSEYGIVGLMSLAYILIDFFRSNAAIRRAVARQSASDASRFLEPHYAHMISLGLQLAFVAVCINSLFYETIYVPLFWHMMAANRLLYFASGADRVAARQFEFPRLGAAGVAAGVTR